MKKYIFLLGRDIQLSFLEVSCLLKAYNVNFEIVNFKNNILLIKSDLLSKEILLRLGGTLKIGEKIEDFNNLYTGNKNKIDYSVIDFSNKNLNEMLKTEFKKLNLKAIPRKNKLSKHLDLEFIAFGNDIFKVIYSSYPKEYKKRDENRPFFDAASVTSIRLAKMLINLSAARKEILDPFCGYATILQEALIMGLNVIGSDTNIEKAKKNLEWLGYKNYKLIKTDVKDLSNSVREVECVVTEPYMGPYYKKTIDYQEGLKLVKELENLYLKTLKELRKIVKKRLVIILPEIKTNKGFLKINYTKMFETAGFKPCILVKGFNNPISCFLPKSIIRRYIYILEPV